MIFAYLFILLLSFYLLAKIVDDFFVPSLDKIAARLKMSDDAAGATLMAVGSSAPELFVALFAVFRPGNHEAVGVGNIVGSALFNLLVIIGVSAVIKKAVIPKQGVLRDLFFYAVSVFLLLIILLDGNISIYEAGSLLLVYVLYVIAVIKWHKFFKPDTSENNLEEKPDKNKTKPKKYIIVKILRPIDFLIGLIFPPLKYYLPVFFISIASIAGISWLLVESAVEIAHILEISETIIALTILAAGTSVPDLISSAIVSKKGRSEMAVSNAVGSNIFDILVGLGLPFLLITIISGQKLAIQTENITESVYYLSASIVVLLVFFLLSKWKVGKIFGYLLLLLYAIYIMEAILSL